MKYTLFLCLILIACSETPENSTDLNATSTQVYPVKTLEIAASDIQDYIVLSGKMEAYQEIVLIASHSAKISSFKENGSFVQKGSDIIDADSKLFYQQFLAAKTQVDIATKNLEKVENMLKTYEKLYQEKSISKDEYQSYELTYLEASQTLHRAKATYEEAKNAYDNSRLAAPFSGHLGQIDLTIGQQIISGQVIGRLADFSKYKVVLSLSANEYQRVSKGNQVRFKANDFELNGLVESLSPIADPNTGTHMAKLVFPGLKNKAMLNSQYGQITILGDVFKNKIIVNQDYILNRDNQKSIFIFENGIAKEIKVHELLQIDKKSVLDAIINGKVELIISTVGRLQNGIKVSKVEG